MKDELSQNPSMFDNDFRNIQNYVEVKLKAEIKRKWEEEAIIAPDYAQLQQDYEKQLQMIMHKYNIKVGSPD